MSNSTTAADSTRKHLRKIGWNTVTANVDSDVIPKDPELLASLSFTVEHAIDVATGVQPHAPGNEVIDDLVRAMTGGTPGIATPVGEC